MSANHSALFWLAATLAAYVVSRVARHYVRAWWTSPLLLTCVLCLGLTIVLHAGYSEYMRGGQWLLLLLGPATVAFAVPIYEHRALIKRHWPTLAVGVAVGCGLAFGGGWLLSGLLGLSQEMRLSLLPRSFTTPFAMDFAREVGGAPDLAAVCVIATGILGASLGGMLLKVLPLRTALARGAMLGMGAHGAGVARALEAGEEEGAIAGLVMILAGVTCALIGPAISLLES
ncbi:LrgB family protein [Solidesulfovibrio magneticus]|uniref:LrgB-like protein n=1 Tax=Solidesulfovibrio magneticus (strain ATCC 700980 / DSM 13731 / RS-1) TaxID=573370 RepID=C4XJ94_SOLM1|nr:LrgB family protein [Solidesulfovibrio magneticus]BAH74258.1 LrgB-like protein [Solidesulfovibrio magneticus RS-1]